MSILSKLFANKRERTVTVDGERRVVTEQTISAIVTRADGTVEDYGVVSAYSDDPEKQEKMNQEIAARRAVLDAEFANRRKPA